MIRVENAKAQVTKDGRKYFSFWINIFMPDGGSYLDAGWKYYPDTQTVGTPTAFSKGKNPKTNGKRAPIYLGKPNKIFYNAVLEDATRYFASLDCVVGSEEETE